MATVSQTRLPAELLLQIIEAVLPANPNALLPPWHTTTKTLLSLTKVSRAANQHATRLLRLRCMYIDSSERLTSVLLCMSRLVHTVPSTLSLRNITWLYLSPSGSSVDDLAVAMGVRELCHEVGGTLRRLVLQTRIGNMGQQDDEPDVVEILKDGLRQLSNLQEFVCLGQCPSIYLPGGKAGVWRLWPNLERLALYGARMDNFWLWWDFALLKKLQHVVIARPPTLDAINVKDEYFHKLPQEDAGGHADIKLLLMDVAYSVDNVQTTNWETIDAEGRMTVEAYEVPIPYYSDESPTQLVTEWMKRGALDGSMWEWTGERMD